MTLGDKKVPIRYQRFTSPLVLPIPAYGKVIGPAATPIDTVLSSIYCQTQDGSKEQWCSHFIDPSVAKRDSLANISDDEWKENCKYAKGVAVSVLGTIEYGKHILVIMKFGPKGKEDFIGIPTVKHDGKYYRDAEADKSNDPFRKWLSQNEYPMVTGVKTE